MIYTEEIYTYTMQEFTGFNCKLVRKELNPEMPGGRNNVGFDLV
jgi:hypothetical protein